MKKLTLISFFILLSTVATIADNPRSLNVSMFRQLIETDTVILIDVRTASEFANGHIEGARNVVWTESFLDTLAKTKLPRNKHIAVYCNSGKRSKKAAEVLVNQGYRVSELNNGWLAWQNDSLYSIGSYQHNQYVTLPYRDASICFQQTDILIVFLHGSSARGTDNEKQITQFAIKYIVNYLINNGITARLLLPQCPTDRYWTERKEIHGCRMPEVLAGLVRKYAIEHHIKRIYIIGEAFGGAGVWQMLTEYPKMFDAAMVIDSYPSNLAKPQKVGKTPLCIVSNRTNTYTDLNKLLPFIETLKKLNADLRIEFIDEDDVRSKIKIYSEDNLKWVLSK